MNEFRKWLTKSQYSYLEVFLIVIGFAIIFNLKLGLLSIPFYMAIFVGAGVVNYLITKKE